ncbi:STAS domain-containing protein [Streptomyces sp. NPDC102259]|uniref:STAS domain-containing protein n=1 Tax=Streptomyces sp. NPDC102259 TaxID=3366148 RepID=UPI00380AB8BD
MNDAEQFRTAVADEGDTLRLSAYGELDLDTGGGLRDALGFCLACPVRRLVVDFSEVPFCDCAGLGVLMEARALAVRRNVSFELVGVQPRVAWLLSLTRTDVAFGLKDLAA